MKKLLIFIFLASTFATSKAQHHNMGDADKPSIHGMLIFGQEKIYASHLPLFHTPHDYQIILELELDKTAKAQFVKDQQQHPEFTTYTIEPEKFVLPEMLKTPKPFKVNIYRGHFERGGTLISKQISVTIKQVIYFKKFDPSEAKANDTKFIIFGNSREQFAAHHITNHPDFEQIVQVNTSLTAMDKQFELILFNTKANSPVGVSGNVIETSAKRKLTLLKQVYLEFDDLQN
jgi:hypothetical protein